MSTDETDEIHDSQYQKEEYDTKPLYWRDNDKSTYHYIDLLAIVQNIKSNANDK